MLKKKFKKAPNYFNLPNVCLLSFGYESRFKMLLAKKKDPINGALEHLLGLKPSYILFLNFSKWFPLHMEYSINLKTQWEITFGPFKQILLRSTKYNFSNGCSFNSLY